MHRFVWELSGRPLPEKPLSIDHINRNPLDNRLENLRIASQSLQCLNKRRSWKKYDHLPTGVYLSKRSPTKPYMAIATHKGKQVCCGHHATPEEASAAYEKKKAELIAIECSVISTL